MELRVSRRRARLAKKGGNPCGRTTHLKLWFAAPFFSFPLFSLGQAQTFSCCFIAFPVNRFRAGSSSSTR
jgi:hypothetical protein